MVYSEERIKQFTSFTPREKAMLDGVLREISNAPSVIKRMLIEDHHFGLKLKE